MINLIVNGFMLISIQNILLSKNGIKNSLAWIFIAFVIGYRTFEPISGLKLHPIEILTYAACLRILFFNCQKYYKMPLSISILGFLFFIHFLLDSLTRYSWIVLLEFKNCMLLYPIFFVLLHIKPDENNLKSTLKYYMFAISAISTLGVAEYFFPIFISNIFGHDPDQFLFQNNSIFNRVSFLFWGSHLAANLIPPVFPILIYLRSKNYKLIKNNIVLTSIILVNLFAIYLSGNRISWLMLTIYLILILFLYPSYTLAYLKTYSLIIVTSFIVYIYSQPVEGRYMSTFYALTGKIDKKYDSSSAARMYRAKVAINSIKNKPMGSGWGSQGWVHSDILQIGASLGIITAIIFTMSQILLLVNIYKMFNKAPPALKSGFFLCFSLLIYSFISFLLNGNILKVQTGAPLFLVWAFSYTFYTHLKSLKTKTVFSNE